MAGKITVKEVWQLADQLHRFMIVAKATSINDITIGSEEQKDMV